MSHRAHRRLAGDAGFGLIEVLVAAVLVVVMATAVLAAIDSASGASGRTKARDVAATLAQADQERMRTMPIADLTNLNETGTKQSCDEDGGSCVNYTVVSRAYWVSDESGTQTCAGSTTDVSYLKLLTTVTWPSIGERKPVVSESMLAPGTSAAAEKQGSLAVRLVRADGTTPLAGIPVRLSGQRSYTATTNAAGCVLWGYLPEGNDYTVSFAQSGYVDVNGVEEVTRSAGVTAQQVNALTILYDRSSSAQIAFTSKLGATTYSGQVADGATLGQNQMSPPLRAFAVAGGTPSTLVEAEGLFPFKSGSPGGPYRVFGGSCAFNDPNAQSPPQPSTFLPNLDPGGPAATVSVPLPSLDTRIRVGGGAPTAAHKATLRFVPTTVGCANPAWTAVAPLAAITSGAEAGRPQLPSGTPAIGFPYGRYAVCAQVELPDGVRRLDATVNLTAATATKVPSSGYFDFSTATPKATCDAPA